MQVYYDMHTYCIVVKCNVPGMCIIMSYDGMYIDDIDVVWPSLLKAQSPML